MAVFSPLSVSRCTNLYSLDDHNDGAKMLTDLYLKLGDIFFHLLWQMVQQAK